MIVPRSLHPGEAHGAHKPRCAARRARMRRGRKSRAAPVGMTKPREICAEFTESREKRKAKREKRNAKYQGPMTKELKT